MKINQDLKLKNITISKIKHILNNFPIEIGYYSINFIPKKIIEKNPYKLSFNNNSYITQKNDLDELISNNKISILNFSGTGKEYNNLINFLKSHKLNNYYIKGKITLASPLEHNNADETAFMYNEILINEENKTLELFISDEFAETEPGKKIYRWLLY